MSRQKTPGDEALSVHYAEHVAILKERHDRALERAGAGHAVIFSGAPLPVFLDDYDYPFKANPHFVSWLPLSHHPRCYIIYTPGHRPVLVYYQEKDYWHLPPEDPEGFWTSQFDIRIVHAADEVSRHLPDDLDKCILIGDIRDDTQALGIERINPGTALNILHYERAVKTGYELDCVRAASRRGVLGHRAAEQAFRSGKTEFDIHLAYCRAVGHADNDLPYGNIIALNENGAVLHYQHQSREKPELFRSFLIDAGARVNGYASDITRTYSKEDDEFAALIEQFDKLQQELVAEVRAGVDFADLHISCHLKIAQLLDHSGLATGDPDTLIETGVTSAFYPARPWAPAWPPGPRCRWPHGRRYRHYRRPAERPPVPAADADARGRPGTHYRTGALRHRHADRQPEGNGGLQADQPGTAILAASLRRDSYRRQRPGTGRRL